ncbi:hypothetical protein NECAME_17119 [Necator americanus]|uniref:Uncharacterized protein n=1 Tax=Necator americanus TaxID=51031 RepID=W2TR30_NECAM|nr:hypothetical protein NECAME_17119 [Necator americanus]ETN84510.1 hypothetical protein NECAME_17119 [Necator americanus]
MNYMCCPTNQSSGRHQHTCPAPTVTVLDSSGAPLRCKSWTRACPQVPLHPFGVEYKEFLRRVV